MTHTTILPIIYGGPVIAAQAEPEPDRARILFDLIRRHVNQGRKLMLWDDLLCDIAESRCWNQATFGWDGHTDPDGHGPNWWVKQHGIKLPNGDGYSSDRAANQIESLAHHGDGTPDGVLQAWLNSPGHRAHILGEGDFYSKQVRVGIGYYGSVNSGKKHYWAFISIPEID